ncbi:E3 ubiquitin-protein ligase At4g11680-like [Durio zibethinus]|uniref:E3 ubiquitin-protein ligase At4g11680-like n=1 Tax=Durio zibethinus TaxID=66656 RepID=A0A6P5ZFS7_DURZI|nr:E3 ubiquitin-protein ligase At4g11680-like [Durio zibethinus]
MEQPPVILHEKNDHVLDVPNDGQYGNNVVSRNSQEPVIQPTAPGGSSHGSSISSFCFWIYVRLVFNISQIVASIAVLIVSRNEKSRAPLSTWIAGYAAGCAASIPFLFQHCFLPYPKLSRLLECFKWMLKAYFLIWFLLGNFWLFRYSSSGAPNLHRLCVMFLVFSYLEFTMPFILCAVLACCCGNLGLIKGATSECINSLPTYTFKLQKDGSGSIRKINSDVKGGVDAAGAEKDTAISGDDAVCCICLASYADNDVLKELPCSHFFHTTCIDKWLKMNALCPLCKCTILSKQ